MSFKWISSLGKSWSYGEGVIVAGSAPTGGNGFNFANPIISSEGINWEMVRKFGDVVSGGGWYFSGTKTFPKQQGEVLSLRQ